METQTAKGGHFKRPEGGAGALEAQKRQDCFWLEKSGKVRLGKMVFESGLEDRGLCSEKEEISLTAEPYGGCSINVHFLCMAT